MEGSGLCGFAGNVGALFGVEGLGDAVEVEAFLAELLEKVGHENRLRNTSGGNEARVFAVAKSAGGKFGGAMGHGKISKVGSPATPAFRDHCVCWIVRYSWWPCRVLESQWWSVWFQESWTGGVGDGM